MDSPLHSKHNQPFDKQIHKDEFKLRLLLTDGCNFNCPFCLNDFQKKPDGTANFLDTETAINAIEAYAQCFRDSDYPLQVYFSGGEPTLHPRLASLIMRAKSLNCRVTLNTNGSFPVHLESFISGYVDCLHFGVYSKDKELAKRISQLRGDVQCVYSTRYPYVDDSFIEFYLKYGMHIKVFGDLFEDSIAYTKYAQHLVEKYPTASLSFRHKGIQENRGIGCTNCDRYCVTLKGAWVFPDGSTSHCPQRCKGKVYYPGDNINSWKDALTEICEQHCTSSVV